jgi:predicted DCC family thiol-disulfide oxidoreductase YuxK
LVTETRIGKGLLIYDGDCGLCSRTAAWLKRRLPAGYEVQPSQRLELEAFDLTRPEVHEHAYWIDPDRTQHRGHRAIARALEASGGTLGFLAPAMRVWPISPLAAWIYHLVARNRHHFPGASDRCRL